MHVEPGAPPGVLARKLVGRTLSDLAAAGATPWALSWTAAVPATQSREWMRRLARAMLGQAAQYGAPIVGGDLSTADAIVLSCSALGRTGSARPPGRRGARSGDVLAVTGRLGGAVTSGRHLRPEPRLQEGRRLAERYEVHAMMDLSDGLARDLPRLLEASQRGAEVDLDALPLSRGIEADRKGFEQAVGEGEDYELLAAMPAADWERARKDPVLRRCGIRAIGKVVGARHGLKWLQAGRSVRLDATGWEHGWS